MPNLGSPSHENAAVPGMGRRRVWRFGVLTGGYCGSLTCEARKPSYTEVPPLGNAPIA